MVKGLQSMPETLGSISSPLSTKYTCTHTHILREYALETHFREGSLKICVWAENSEKHPGKTTVQFAISNFPKTLSSVRGRVIDSKVQRRGSIPCRQHDGINLRPLC